MLICCRKCGAPNPTHRSACFYCKLPITKADASAALAGAEDNTPRIMAFVHALNLFLLCALVIICIVGYYHVPAELPGLKLRPGSDPWPLEYVHYWFRPMIFFMAIAGVAYLFGFVYNRARDDQSDAQYCGAGLILFAGCIIQLADYFSLHGQNHTGGILLIFGLTVVVLVIIVLARLGYSKD